MEKEITLTSTQLLNMLEDAYREGFGADRYSGTSSSQWVNSDTRSNAYFMFIFGKKNKIDLYDLPIG